MIKIIFFQYLIILFNGFRFDSDKNCKLSYHSTTYQKITSEKIVTIYAFDSYMIFDSNEKIKRLNETDFTIKYYYSHVILDCGYNLDKFCQSSFGCFQFKTIFSNNSINLCEKNNKKHKEFFSFIQKFTHLINQFQWNMVITDKSSLNSFPRFNFKSNKFNISLFFHKIVLKNTKITYVKYYNEGINMIFKNNCCLFDNYNICFNTETESFSFKNKLKILLINKETFMEAMSLSILSNIIKKNEFCSNVTNDFAYFNYHKLKIFENKTNSQNYLLYNKFDDFDHFLDKYTLKNNTLKSLFLDC